MKKINKATYLAAFSLATLIFLAGFFLNQAFTDYRLGLIEESQESLRTQLLGIELQTRLLEENICGLSSQDLWGDKVLIGREITKLEEKLGKENKFVVRQKEFYQLIEIRTLFLLKEIQEKCDQDFSIILFFYTNKKNDIKGDYKVSEDQGFILDNLYRRYGNEVAILSFDINTDNPALNTFKDLYNINSAPTLVIDEDVNTRFMGFEEIEDLIKKT